MQYLGITYQSKPMPLCAVGSPDTITGRKNLLINQAAQYPSPQFFCCNKFSVLTSIGLVRKSETIRKLAQSFRIISTNAITYSKGLLLLVTLTWLGLTAKRQCKFRVSNRCICIDRLALILSIGDTPFSNCLAYKKKHNWRNNTVTKRIRVGKERNKHSTPSKLLVCLPARIIISVTTNLDGETVGTYCVLEDEASPSVAPAVEFPPELN